MNQKEFLFLKWLEQKNFFFLVWLTLDFFVLDRELLRAW